MEQQAKIFKALSDPLRLRLAVLLSRQEEVCVCKLVEALQEPQFKVSRHLSVLRNAGMVQARRQGTWMHYRLVPPKTQFDRSVQNCLEKCSNQPPKSGRKPLKHAKC